MSNDDSDSYSDDDDEEDYSNPEDRDERFRKSRPSAKKPAVKASASSGVKKSSLDAAAKVAGKTNAAGGVKRPATSDLSNKTGSSNEPKKTKISGMSIICLAVLVLTMFSNSFTEHTNNE